MLQLTKKTFKRKPILYGIPALLFCFITVALYYTINNWFYAFFVLLLINALFFFANLKFVFGDKFSRNNIGFIHSDSNYLKVISKVATKWLKHTPPLELWDYSPTLLDYMLKVASGKKIARNPLKYSWPHAILAKGVISLAEATNCSDCHAAINKYFTRFVAARSDTNNSLVIHKLDEGLNGEVALFLYKASGEKRFLNAADDIANYYLNRAIKENGTIAYLAPDPTGLRFVDAIAFMCPFLANYGVVTDNSKAIELSFRQLKDFFNYGIDSKTGLPFHAYDPKNDHAPVGLVGWGRGCGWLAMGLIDTIGVLEENNIIRQDLEPFAIKLAQSIVRFQCKEGGWSTLLTRSNGGFESSATALLTYFLLRSIEMKIIKGKIYELAVENAIMALKKHTRSDGQVDFAQGNCMGFDRMSKRFAPTSYSLGITLALMVKIIHK